MDPYMAAIQARDIQGLCVFFCAILGIIVFFVIAFFAAYAFSTGVVKLIGEKNAAKAAGIFALLCALFAIAEGKRK